METLWVKIIDVTTDGMTAGKIGVRIAEKTEDVWNAAKETVRTVVFRSAAARETVMTRMEEFLAY